MSWSAFPFCPRRSVIVRCDCSYAFPVLHFNQSCLCTGSETTCHFNLPSECSPLSLIFFCIGVAIHFKLSATPLDCNWGKKVHTVQSWGKTEKRKMKRQSKERTKCGRDFLLSLVRQSPQRLQRKPATGRRLIQGSRPHSHTALQVTTKVQACFQNLLHTRSNSGKKNRDKAMLEDVIRIKASDSYFPLTQIYYGDILPCCLPSSQQLHEGF